MKKLAIMLVVAMMTASLVACGCTDRNAQNNSNGGGTQSENSGGGANNEGNASDSGVRRRMGEGMNDMGNGLKNAADDVGDAVNDLIGGGRANGNTTGNNAGPDGLQRMISNAHVHDKDGVLADNENSRS